MQSRTEGSPSTQALAVPHPGDKIWLLMLFFSPAGSQNDEVSHALLDCPHFGNFLARNTRGCFCGFLARSCVYWAPQTANRLPNCRDEFCAIRLSSRPARRRSSATIGKILVLIVPPTASVAERGLYASGLRILLRRPACNVRSAYFRIPSVIPPCWTRNATPIAPPSCFLSYCCGST